jgi:hypothetical protein
MRVGRRESPVGSRRELKHLTTPRSVAWGMSDATKVVLGTVVVAGLLALTIVLAMAL